MKKQLIKAAVLITIIAATFTSCSKNSSVLPLPGEPGDGNNPPAGGAGKTVTGIVKDVNGNPVAGADVRAENDVYNAFVEGKTDADGRYSLPGVEWGGWKIYAWKDAVFNGKTYHLRMGMPATEDYEPFAGDLDKSVTKNFVWKLDGEIPDRSRDELNSFGWFGGSVNFATLDINFNALPDGTEVTVTCTPESGAVLFDGSPAPTVVRKFTAHDTSPATWTYVIHDIPQSIYSISATCIIKGKTKRILLGREIDETTHETIDDFFFQPDGSSHGNYESGLRTQTDEPIYMRVE